jgi:hypothetical protein
MEFLKKNYEKVILSVVLLGLAVAAGLLLKQVADERKRLDDISRMDLTTQPKELEPADISTNLVFLGRLQRPGRLVLSGTNNLFNPVEWRQVGDGRPVKVATGRELGAGALQITRVTNLFLKISYEGQTGAGDTVQYRFRVEREAERSQAGRRPVTLSFAAVGSRVGGLLLRSVRPPEKPVAFTLELLDDKAQVVVGDGKDYRRVAGYMVDLRYEPERLSWQNRRLDDRLVFAGETNKIVAITETNVTVEASNRKRTTVLYNALSPTASP